MGVKSASPVVLILTGLLLLIGAPGCGSRSRDIPVVFISIDTLRADHLGCYGYVRNTSPVIDRFAKESILCRQAFSHSAKTAPSHMSMFTSLYPTVHGVHMFNRKLGPIPYRLDEKIKPLAEVLRENGYTCVAFTGGGNVGADYGFDRGFSIYDTGMGHWERGIRWIAGHSTEPFFIFLHTYVVHDPYFPPEPFYSMFNPDYIGKMLRPGGPEREDMTSQVYWGRVDTGDPRDVEQLVSLYDGEIRYMDERMMQPLLRILKTSGLWQKAIVVFTADHGEEFGEHGRFKHEQVYDELLHVPLIVHLPKAIARRMPPGEIPHQVRLIDIMPTLMDLLDIHTPTHRLQGTSLVPFFRREESAGRVVYATRVVSSIRGTPYVRNYVLRLDGKKLIRNVNYRFRLGVPWEFYDLRSDPGEMKNLVTEARPVPVKYRKMLFQISSANRKLREAGGYHYHGVRFKAESLERLRALGYVR